jgi:sugar transferase (PEP-CTERM system associated)
MLKTLARYSSLRNLGIMAVEFVMLLGCAVLAFVIRFHDSFIETWKVEQPGLRIVLLAVILQLSGYFLDQYEFRPGHDESVRRRLIAIATSGMAVLLIQQSFPWLVPGRGVLAIALALMALFYFGWHSSLRAFLGRAPRAGILVLGTNRLAQDLAREIIKRPEMRLKVEGFLTNDAALVGVRLVNPCVIGLTEDLPRLVDQLNIKSVVVALNDRRGVLPTDDLLALKCRGVTVEDGTTVYERVTGKIAVDNLKPSWLIFSEGFEVSKQVLLIKDIFSFAVSLLLLVLAGPVMVLAAVAIMLESRGPLFFRQERVGKGGRVFTLWKFRSMRADAEKETGPVYAAEHDTRVTRVGRVLRKTRIDELPQLWNVLKGDMSFVGPRPERPMFVKQLEEKLPYYGLRHIVKPGITGWAQVNYGYGRNDEDTVEKLQYDLYYIKNLSLMLDILTLFETAKAVLKGRGI